MGPWMIRRRIASQFFAQLRNTRWADMAPGDWVILCPQFLGFPRGVLLLILRNSFHWKALLSRRESPPCGDPVPFSLSSGPGWQSLNSSAAWAHEGFRYSGTEQEMSTRRASFPFFFLKKYLKHLAKYGIQQYLCITTYIFTNVIISSFISALKKRNTDRWHYRSQSYFLFSLPREKCYLGMSIAVHVSILWLLIYLMGMEGVLCRAHTFSALER